jgi:hypothetical protein
MELSIENLAFLGILFVALAGIWALVRSQVSIANLIPFPLVQELIRSAVNTALDLAEERATLTPGTADDELVKMIKDEVKKLLPAIIAEAVSTANAAPLSASDKREVKALAHEAIDESLPQQAIG